MDWFPPLVYSAKIAEHAGERTSLGSNKVELLFFSAFFPIFVFDGTFVWIILFQIS